MAAIFSLDKHRDQSLTLMARAVANAPNRPDLVLLQSQLCQKISHCDPEPIELRLRQLDPRNGEGWMGAFVRGEASGDREATDAAFTEISRSDRVDVYWTGLIARLTRAVAGTKALSVEDAGVIVIGYLAAEPLPGYTDSSRRCKGEPLDRAGAVDICRGVAKAFQQGDTYLTEMIGVAVAKRVWPEDSPEWKAAADARRRYEYQSKLWMKLEAYTLSHAEEYLTLYAQNHREQDVFTAQIIAAGEDPNPPSAQ